MSYFEGYIDFTGRVKAYAVVDLRVLGDYDWRLSPKNVWKVEQLLLDWPHRKIASSDARADRMRKRYAAFREAHGYKPWKLLLRAATAGRRCRPNSPSAVARAQIASLAMSRQS